MSDLSEPTPQNTRVIVFAYPDGCIPVQLADWVFTRYRCSGFPADNILIENRKGLIQARNHAIQAGVLAAPKQFRWFLMIDKDVIPDKRSDEIYGLDSDVRVVRARMNNPNAWKDQDTFHDPMYLARRSVFESVGLPAFTWPFNEACTELTECVCQGFARKVKEHGFTIENAGFAEHQQANSWH